MTDNVRPIARVRARCQLLTLMAVLVIGGPPVCTPSHAATSLDRLRSGLDLLEAGDLASAEEFLTEAARLSSDLSEAQLALGALKLTRGDNDAAGRAFLAHTQGPAAGVAHLGAGSCFLLQGNLALAEQHYRAAIQSGLEREAAARSGVAYALCALGDYASAREQARAALAFEGDEPVALETLASAEFALGDLKQAHRAIRQALLAPDGEGAGPLAPPTALECPILRRDSAYYASTDWAQRERWAMALPVAQTNPAASAARDDGMAILSPSAGQRVEGIVPVKVRAPETTHFLFLHVDGRLAGISNAPPFALTCDAGALPAGAHELAVEAYDAAGSLLARAEAVVLVKTSGGQTLAPATDQELRAVRERLGQFLRPRPRPLSAHALLAKVLEARGDDAGSLAQREYVFCAEPDYPGSRADLLWSYDRLGLLAPGGEEVIRGFPAGGRRIALTFDDGPHPSLTPRILDLLDRFGLKATFFLIGKQAELYPDLVAEIHRRGHELGNHSYSHVNLATLPRLEVERELVKTRAVIREACGATITLFRPPGGNYNGGVDAAARAMGFRTVLWTATISSYQGRDDRETLSGMLHHTQDGGIILLHSGNDETVDVAASLLSSLEREGLTPTTVSDMLRGS